jgi:pimeloyl-ACP methyl ester carboxylesterase
MEIDRRAFMASLGEAAVAINFLESSAFALAPDQQAPPAGFDPRALRTRANADGEFLLKARYWDAHLRVEIGDHPYDVLVQAGKVVDFKPAVAAGSPDVRIVGPAQVWTTSFALRGLTIEGDPIRQTAPYRGAIMRLVTLVREALNGPTPENLVKDVDRQFDTAVGRYVYVRIQGVQYRVYYEEAGQGIPIVLQHTAGSDSRQWRHMLEDADLQKKFRMIAYDLPFHGKSVPPTGVKWWEQEYRLTRELVMDSVVAISQALKADRPIYMGCSVGGYLAPDLALYHPGDFRAVVGVNSSISGGRAASIAPTAIAEAQAPISQRKPGDYYYYPDYHPRVCNEYTGVSMYGITSPEAPEAYRRETAWVYSQAGPGVYAGDLYYYNIEHDLTGRAQQIATSKIEVHFLSGEYDGTANPGPRGAQALSAQIPGSTYQVIRGGSHFAMSDDYSRFRPYVVELLDRIRARNL